MCYHYFVGLDGSVVQTRDDSERMGCTMNEDVNNDSIQIVLAGAFEYEKPTRRQLDALHDLITRLENKYGIQPQNIIGHREASPTTCPGKNLMAWIKATYRNE